MLQFRPDKQVQIRINSGKYRAAIRRVVDACDLVLTTTIRRIHPNLDNECLIGQVMAYFRCDSARALAQQLSRLHPDAATFPAIVTENDVVLVWNCFPTTTWWAEVDPVARTEAHEYLRQYVQAKYPVEWEYGYVGWPRFQASRQAARRPATSLAQFRQWFPRREFYPRSNP